MLTLTAEQQEALAQREVMLRHFIYCWARDPITGDPSPAGFWNDVGTVTMDGRVYEGSGSVVTIGTLSARSDLTIPGLALTMSGVSAAAIAMVRGKSIGQAPIEVSLGIFDVASHSIIGPLVRRFVGRIDTVSTVTPPAGGKATITFNCESASRALTIKRTGTRSSATQRERSLTDAFYDYTAGQSGQKIYFGKRGP